MAMKIQKIQKLNSAYIGEGFAQVMTPYSDDYMTILSGEGIIYHSDNSDGQAEYYNEYLNDSRRFQFPYHSIPIHREKKDGSLITYVNEIFEIGKNYLILKDSKIVQDVLLRSSRNPESVLAVHRVLSPVETRRVNCANSHELNDQINEEINAQKGKKYVFSDGGILSQEINYEDKKINEIRKRESKVVITTNNDLIKSIIGFKILKKGYNFNLVVFEIPMRKYSSDVIRPIEAYASPTPEPKIKRRINPGVTIESIISSKSMARYKDKKYHSKRY